MMAWKSQVDYGKDWDHKSRIEDKFMSKSGNSRWHVYHGTAYHFDIWSNIHYGYVGRSIGFKNDLLLDGAGLAQFKHDLNYDFPPKSTGESSGWRQWDHPEDRGAISAGVDLYSQHPAGVTVELLLQLVFNTKGLATMPAKKVTPSTP